MTPHVRRPVLAGRRRWVALGAVVAVLALVLLARGLLPDQGDGGSERAAAATTTAAPPSETAAAASPPVGPAPTGPTGDATALPASLAAVPVGQTTQVTGVAISVPALEAIEGTGSGPGNVAGPAVRVTIRIDNGTEDPLDLSGVAVELVHGADRVPASPLGDPSAAPFAGTVAPGESGEAVYVFSVPADDRDAVTVSVSYQPGASYAVFTGAA